MANIVCIKCGMRGDSKCPHCRNSYPNQHSDLKVSDALESIEMRIGYKEEPGTEGKDGKSKYIINFWTYAKTGDEAMVRMLEILKHNLNILPDSLIKVAACDHEWHFMPGAHSEIACGHDAIDAGITEVPNDPFLEI